MSTDSTPWPGCRVAPKRRSAQNKPSVARGPMRLGMDGRRDYHADTCLLRRAAFGRRVDSRFHRGFCGVHDRDSRRWWDQEGAARMDLRVQENVAVALVDRVDARLHGDLAGI